MMTEGFTIRATPSRYALLVINEDHLETITRCMGIIEDYLDDLGLHLKEESDKRWNHSFLNEKFKWFMDKALHEIEMEIKGIDDSMRATLDYTVGSNVVQLNLDLLEFKKNSLSQSVH